MQSKKFGKNNQSSNGLSGKLVKKKGGDSSTVKNRGPHIVMWLQGVRILAVERELASGHDNTRKRTPSLGVDCELVGGGPNNPEGNSPAVPEKAKHGSRKGLICFNSEKNKNTTGAG